MDRKTDVVPRRSLLFAPALRPDRFAKALHSGADIVCLDLEDAIAMARKDEARAMALPAFAAPAEGGAARVLRVNSLRSLEGLKDMVALSEGAAAPEALMLPKVTSPEEVAWVDDLLSEIAAPTTLMVIIETARGLEAAPEIATASPRLVALLFGAADLSAELGASMEWEAMLYGRSRTVQAAATAGLDVLDVPHLDLEDDAGLRRAAQQAQQLGFTGKAAIHPKQLPAIHEAFSPTAETIAWARRVVDAFDADPDGLLVLDGKLVEMPVVRAMRRALAIADLLDNG